MPSPRFVLDEQSLRMAALSEELVEENLECLADELQELQVSKEDVGLHSDWESIASVGGAGFCDLIYGNQLDRDLRLRLMILLNKCVPVDDESSHGIDDRVKVNDRNLVSYGVGWALVQIVAGRATAVVTMPYCQERGVCRVSNSGSEESVCFVCVPEDHPAFYRSLYDVEDVPESQFFQHTSFAFPKLVFADGLSFGKFSGSYRVRRAEVVRHLGVLNDSFRNVYVSEAGNASTMSTRLGIDVSRESSNTRNSERKMRFRDVEFAGRTFRCEWHSKLEPEIDRIHFYPGDELGDGKLLIGIFVDHLVV